MMPCVVFAGGCVATEAMLRVCALSGRQTVRQAPAFANANFPSELPSGSRRCRLAGMGQSARNRDSDLINMASWDDDFGAPSATDACARSTAGASTCANSEYAALIGGLQCIGFS